MAAGFTNVKKFVPRHPQPWREEITDYTHLDNCVDILSVQYLNPTPKFYTAVGKIKIAGRNVRLVKHDQFWHLLPEVVFKKIVDMINRNTVSDQSKFYPLDKGDFYPLTFLILARDNLLPSSEWDRVEKPDYYYSYNRFLRTDLNCSAQISEVLKDFVDNYVQDMVLHFQQHIAQTRFDPFKVVSDFEFTFLFHKDTYPAPPGVDLQDLMRMRRI